MSRKSLAASAVALLVTATAAFGQVGGLRFEKTVPYRLDETLSLGATVGAVRIDSVVFSTGGNDGGMGGIMSRMRPGAGDPEVTATIKAGFDAQSPTEDEWEITYVLEFLDGEGRLIDRATKNASIEGEAKIVSVDHSILKYVVPAIARVRVKLEARRD